MSESPLPEPPQWPGWMEWMTAVVGVLILISSIVLVFILWTVDSADPPPGSLLDPPVTVTTTPQVPDAHSYVRRT